MKLEQLEQSISIKENTVYVVVLGWLSLGQDARMLRQRGCCQEYNYENKKKA